VVFAFCRVLPGFQDSYKVSTGENGDRTKETDIKWRLGYLVFILFSVNQWDGRVRGFSAKAVFKCVSYINLSVTLLIYSEFRNSLV
jgi:hypothetical protein